MNAFGWFVLLPMLILFTLVAGLLSLGFWLAQLQWRAPKPPPIPETFGMSYEEGAFQAYKEKWEAKHGPWPRS